MKKITLGGGCFWGLDSCFSNMKGIINCYPGYSGGDSKNNIKSFKDKIENAEVVQLEYDPNLISIKEINLSFFSIHDPSSINDKLNINKNKYRSIILYHNEEQKTEAIKIINIFNKKLFNNKIKTIIQKYKEFIIAKDKHKDYYLKNSNTSYCSTIIKPKLDKFKKNYDNLLSNLNNDFN